MGLILKRPLRTASHAEPDGEEIDRQGQRDGEERDDAAEFGAAGEFIEEDEADQHDQQHPPLGERMFAIHLEEHNERF